MNIPCIKYLTLTMIVMIAGVMSGAQTITTFAGNGVSGYSGDGHPATNARVAGTQGLAIDHAGNMYVSDPVNHCLREVSVSGIITTIAGTGAAGYSGDGGPATAAELDHPVGICVDKYDNIYFADYKTSTVREISTSGIISTVAGTGVYGFSGDGGAATATTLLMPFGVVTDTMGNLYIADQTDGRVRMVNTAGIISTFAGGGVPGYLGDGGPATMAGMYAPEDLAIDAIGNIYIADGGDSRIRKVDIAGNIWTIAGDGTYGFSGDGGAATAAKLRAPCGVVADNNGNIYIADLSNFRIREVNTAGIIRTVAGTGSLVYNGDGIPATNANMNFSGHLITDLAGNLYISDFYNYRIREVHCASGPYVPPILSGSFICAGTPITLSDDVAGGGWTSDNTDIATIDSITGVISPRAKGAVVIAYKFTNACGTATGKKTIVIDSLPDTAGVITGADHICPDDVVLLSNAIPGGTWGSARSFIATIDMGGNAKGLSPGSDKIFYMVSNACGTDTAIFPLTVRPFAECGSQWIDIAPTITTAATTISVSPNPNNGSFTLTLSESNEHEGRIMISDVTGRKIKDVARRGNEMEIRLEAPPGVYFVTVVTSSSCANTTVVIR